MTAGSAAAGVVAAAGTRVARAGALHHAAALLAGGTEVEAGHLGWDHRGRFGEGRGSGLGAAVATAVGRARGAAAGVDPEAELGGLGVALGPYLRGEDAEVLQRFGVVDEAARQPAHDVVGHRLGEGDLRV